MIDKFFTPPGLASFLTGASRMKRPTRIADFAMGDGALLKAARVRWPRAKFVGADIDPAAAEFGPEICGDFEFSAFDFLSDGPRPSQMDNMVGQCDVILLNPPFSSRGNKRYWAPLDGERLSGSKALAFVVRSLEFLSNKGEALAIVPASCMTSERDRLFLGSVSKHYAVEVLSEIRRNGFPGCSVSVVALRISRRRTKLSRSTNPVSSGPVAVRPCAVSVFRGSTPVFRCNTDGIGVPVLHTTHLGAASSDFPSIWVGENRNSLRRKLVVLPRVGRPDIRKLCLIQLTDAVLSDCVIGLSTSPTGHEDALLRCLRNNWDDLRMLYAGSCAPYITLGQLRGFLSNLGFKTVIAEPPRRSAPSESRAVA